MDYLNNEGGYGGINPQPGRPRIFITLLHAIWPPVLYMAIQYLVSLIGSIMIGINISLDENLSQLTGQELADATYKMAESMIMPVMGVSIVLCLAVFIPVYRYFRRGQEKTGGLSSLGFMNIILILAMTITAYFAIASIISFLPQNFGNYDEHIEGLTTGSFAAQLLVIGIGAPVVEEFCMRGISQGRLEKIMPPAAAIILQAAIFGIIHFNIVQSSYAFLMGILLGWLCYRTRSLWAPILCHIFLNTGSVLLSELSAGAGEIVVEEPVDEYYGLVIIMVVSLVLTALLIYALNKTLPGRKKQEANALPWDL